MVDVSRVKSATAALAATLDASQKWVSLAGWFVQPGDPMLPLRKRMEDDGRDIVVMRGQDILVVHLKPYSSVGLRATLAERKNDWTRSTEQRRYRRDQFELVAFRDGAPDGLNLMWHGVSVNFRIAGENRHLLVDGQLQYPATISTVRSYAAGEPV